MIILTGVNQLFKQYTENIPHATCRYEDSGMKRYKDIFVRFTQPITTYDPQENVMIVSLRIR